MSKYIIELDDRIKLVTSVGVTENGVVYTTSDYVHNLEELNSDYINEHYGQLQDEAYQRGLDDAWEAAKKLFSTMSDTEIEKVFPVEWKSGFSGLMQMKPQYAMAKIKAYEEKQKANDEIKVGDEIKVSDTNWIVTANDGDMVQGIDAKGIIYSHYTNKVTKTGRHFDIASILEEMKE